MPATAKVIVLKGDPKKPESAEHIIKFPGGSISVCRTSTNEYWAHIEVNHKPTVLLEEAVREAKAGEVVGSRVDYNRPPGEVREIPDMEEIQHIAIKIKTSNTIYRQRRAL